MSKPEVDLSTLHDFPTKMELIAILHLPSDWFWSDMKKAYANLLDDLRGAVLMFGGAAGGAVLMKYLLPSSVTIGLGFLAGATVGAVLTFRTKFSQMKLSGLGLDLQFKLEAVAKDAAQAKALAQLLAEIAIDIGNRSRGVLGGGSLSQNDRVRKMLAERLKELGFDKKEASDFAKFDDPNIAGRIIQSMVLKAVEKTERLEKEQFNQLVLHLLGKDAPREPDTIAEALGPDLLKDTTVKAAVDFYRQWHADEAKLYFVVNNLGRFHEAEKTE